LSRTPEFLPLSDDAVRAVSGPNGRHAALIEDAFKVLIETPGGGVTITGDVKGRTGAKRALRRPVQRADAGDEVVEADVRIAVGEAQSTAARPRPAPCARAMSRPRPRARPATWRPWPAIR
jgi:phosphate starvation-inducible PhoH-like protein